MTAPSPSPGSPRRTRRNRPARPALLAALVGQLAAGCGAPAPEEQVLGRFFQAARLRDTTVLAAVSDVTFEPSTEGSIQRFELAALGEEHLQAEGKTVWKDVTVHAQVRRPDGQVVERTLLIRMRRAVDDERRWIIMAVQSQANSDS